MFTFSTRRRRTKERRASYICNVRRNSSVTDDVRPMSVPVIHLLGRCMEGSDWSRALLKRTNNKQNDVLATDWPNSFRREILTNEKVLMINVNVSQCISRQSE